MPIRSILPCSFHDIMERDELRTATSVTYVLTL
jgi:hypothetical protein